MEAFSYNLLCMLIAIKEISKAYCARILIRFAHISKNSIV